MAEEPDPKTPRAQPAAMLAQTRRCSAKGTKGCSPVSGWYQSAVVGLQSIDFLLASPAGSVLWAPGTGAHHKAGGKSA